MYKEDSTRLESLEEFKRRLSKIFNEALQDCFLGALVEALGSEEYSRGKNLPIFSRARLVGFRLGASYLAAYNPVTSSISFSQLFEMDVSNLNHELIHTFQASVHNLRGKKSEPESKQRRNFVGMMEFEGVLVRDIIRYINLKDKDAWRDETDWAPMAWGDFDKDKGNRKEKPDYIFWIDSLTRGGTQYPEINVEDVESQFYRFAVDFGNSSRSYPSQQRAEQRWEEAKRANRPMTARDSVVYQYGSEVGYKPTALSKMFEIRRKYNKCK